MSRLGRRGSSGWTTVLETLGLVVVVAIAAAVAWPFFSRGSPLFFGTTANDDPVVESFRWAPAAVVLGNYSVASVTVSGGTPPYAYSWSGLPSPCASSDLPSVGCDSGLAGTFQVYATVVDAGGHAAIAGASFTVSPTPGGPSVNRPPGTEVDLESGDEISSSAAAFFGLVVQPTCSACLAGGDGTFVNLTPIDTLRYGLGQESCDLVNDTYYSASGVATGDCPASLVALRDWCDSLDPHCRFTLTIPAEIDDPAYAGYMANYVVHTLGLTPTYWSIGNEPEAYTEWGRYWTAWSSSPAAPPDGAQYAAEVGAYARSLLSVVPTAQIIGIQSDAASSSLIPALAASAAATYLAAIAFHAYPAPGGSGVDAFLDTLDGPHSLLVDAGEVRHAIVAANASLADLPIVVGEYNGGPAGSSPSSFDRAFPDVLLYMGGAIEALEAGVSELDYFALSNDGFSLVSSSDAPDPAGTWLEGMKGVEFGDAYNDTVSGDVPNVWSAEWVSGSDHTLLVVNANVSQQLSLYVDGNFATDTPGATVFWNGTLSAPRVQSLDLPAYYAVPPESILLVEDYT